MFLPSHLYSCTAIWRQTPQTAFQPRSQKTWFSSFLVDNMSDKTKYTSTIDRLLRLTSENMLQFYLVCLAAGCCWSLITSFRAWQSHDAPRATKQNLEVQLPLTDQFFSQSRRHVCDLWDVTLVVSEQMHFSNNTSVFPEVSTKDYREMIRKWQTCEIKHYLQLYWTLYFSSPDNFSLNWC